MRHRHLTPQDVYVPLAGQQFILLQVNDDGSRAPGGIVVGKHHSILQTGSPVTAVRIEVAEAVFLFQLPQDTVPILRAGTPGGGHSANLHPQKDDAERLRGEFRSGDQAAPVLRQVFVSLDLPQESLPALVLVSVKKFDRNSLPLPCCTERGSSTAVSNGGTHIEIAKTCRGYAGTVRPGGDCWRWAWAWAWWAPAS